MKKCPFCGADLADEASICNACGNQIPAAASETSQTENARTDASRSGYTQPVFTQADNGGAYNGGAYIAPRNIALCIIFSIITCGIYAIYWMIKMNDEINTLSGERNATSGGMVFLFSLITCNIYQYYWLYKMGERVSRIKKAQNGDDKILYMLLGIFGLAIVSYGIMQSEINTAVGGQN